MVHILSHGWINEGVIAFLNKIAELALKDASRNAGHGVVCLGDGLTFGHPLRPDLRKKSNWITRG